MECGAQCVITTGMSELHKLCADNWDMFQVSYSCQNLVVLHDSLLPASVAVHGHPVLSNASLFYHLDNVYCRGYENMLSECRHNVLGVHNCVINQDEAGIHCISKFCVKPSAAFYIYSSFRPRV